MPQSLKQIRITIAQFCGKFCKEHKWQRGRWWRNIHEDLDGYYKECSVCGVESEDGIEIQDWFLDEADIPDYPNDLNAMHEAEKLIYSCSKDELWSKYLDNLDIITRAHHNQYWDMIHASAKQRARAFILTIKK